MRLCQQLSTQDLLDYGCGKSTLANNLPFSIQQYDPAVDKYKALPSPADIVVCTDVLEHIEPELIDNVLAHIASVMKRAAYLVANTRPAVKTLADGRNAHILLRPPKWWCEKMYEHFEPITFVNNDGNVVFIVKPKGASDEQEKAEKKDGQINERNAAKEKINHGDGATRAEPANSPGSDFFVGL